MSNTVDSRVVEMRFDNRQFESNVSTSMSTLDKLKEKLNLTSSAKNLENVTEAAKKCDMSGLGRGIEAVHAKFSALQVVGVTALANIANSAVNTGKRMVKALTIDPIKTGLQEYETQINAVQTILANTQKEGATIKDVNSALDELNTYADKTIYNFTEMTRNIGTFTAAGVKLETSVSAIQGIANLAAVSGSNSQQASTAMYQLSQALASGTVKLMDWNSVVNAGMGGQVFQDALKETSRLLGTGADEAIKAEGSFRESLTTGWLTAEVLTETLKKFTTSGANEYVAEYTGLSKEAVEAALKEAEARYGEADAIDKAAEALAKKSGKNKEEIKEALQFAKTAEDAATKVKTFTQLWDVLKEAAQSGWAQTWRLIIGDFEQAKELFTPLADFLTNFINKMSEARNTLLEKAFDMGFGKLKKNIDKTLGPIKKVAKGAKEIGDKVENVTASIDNLGTVVDNVISGDFGNGKERFDKLTAAGQNYYRVQNEINEKLGVSFRHSEKLVEEQDKLIAANAKVADTTEEVGKATENIIEDQKERLKTLVKLSDKQLRAQGYTEEQIKALKELKKTAKDLGIPLNEFIDNLDKINGRWLLINSFKNIGKSLVKIFGSIGDAFRDVFDPIQPKQLFNAIAAFSKFTSQLIISDKTAEKLRSTFKGLFAIVSIIGRIMGGGIRIAFTIVSAICKAFGGTVLDVTAGIGELIYKFNEWLKAHDPLVKIIEFLAEKLPPIIEKFKEIAKEAWVDSGAADNFKELAKGLESIWNVLHGKFSLSLNSTIKILNTVLAAFGTNMAGVLSKVAEYIAKAVEWIRANTMIMDGVGKISNIIVLIIKGLGKFIKAFVALEPVQEMIESIKDSFSKLLEFFNTDFKGSTLDTLYNSISDFFTKLEAGLSNLSNSDSFQKGLDVVEGLAEGISSGLGKVLNAIKDIAKNLIDTFCSMLGIHSPSLIFMGFGAFIMAGLAIGLKKGMPEVYNTLQDVLSNVFNIVGDILQNGLPKIYDFIKLLGSKLYVAFDNFDLQINELFVAGSIIATLLLVKQALGIAEKLTKPIVEIGNIFKKFVGVLKSTSKFIDAKALEVKSQAILNLAKAIAILAASVFLLSKIPVSDLIKAGVAITVLTVLIAALVVVASKGEGITTVGFAKLSVLLISLGITLLLFSAAIKKIAELDPEKSQLAVSELVYLIIAFSLVFIAFGKFVRGKAAENIEKTGVMLTKMALAIGLLAIVIKLMGKLEWGDIAKGGAVITGAFVMFYLIAKFTKRISKNIDLAATAILKMSLAIGLLAIVIKLLGRLELGEVIQGSIAIAALFAMFWAMTKLCKNISKNLDPAAMAIIKMSLAIGLLAIVIKLLGNLELGEVIQGSIAVAALFAMFWAMTKWCKNISKNLDLAAMAILKMSAAILLLSYSIRLLGKLDLGDILKGELAIAAFFAMFWVLMKYTKRVSKTMDYAGTALVRMSGAIILLSIAILLLSMLDAADVAKGTLAVVAMLYMFSIVSEKLRYVSEKSLKTLGVLTAAIGILAGALIALAFLDPEKVAMATLSLVAVMGMFAVLIKVTQYAAGSLGPLVVMTIAIAMIGGVLYFLSKLPYEQSLKTTAALSMVLLALSVALLICAKAGNMALKAVAGLAIILAVLGALVGIFAIMNSFDINVTIATAGSLSLLLLTMSASLLILSAVGAAAPAALAGAGILLAVILAIGAILVGVGALFKKCAELDKYIDKGIEVIGKIGTAIGMFIGGIFGGIAVGVSAGLPAVGANLAKFMENAKPFIEGLKNIDPSAAEAAKSLGQAILAITKGEVLDAIAGWITGKNSMAEFAKSLVVFGEGIKAYGEVVSGIDTVSITASADAAKALADVANNLPKKGGWAQDILGSKDLGEFGASLISFGSCITAYGNSISGIDAGPILASAKSAEAMAKVAQKLPKEGGWAQDIMGAQDISSFGIKLLRFGMCMKTYSETIGDINTEKIEASATAGDALVRVAKKVPKSGGWAQSLLGSNDMGKFGETLEGFGSAIKTYASSVKDLNVDAVKSSAKAADAMVQVLKKTSGIEKSDAKEFVNAINELSKADMAGVAEAFENSETTADMVSTGVKMIKSVGKGMKNSAKSIKSSAKSVAESAASGFESENSSVKAAGKSMATAFANGIKSVKGVKTAAKTLATKASDAVDNNLSGFRTAGKNAVIGFCNGIKKNTYRAEARAKTMAKAAEKAAKKELKINSPSKKFMEIGQRVPEGFALGINKFGGLVKKSIVGMSNNAMNDTQKALFKVGRLLDADLDVQPTISPVVDLSNIEAGAGAINSLLGQDIMFGASANLSAINDGMSLRNQNGVNDDVVSAINKLRKDLGNIGGDTYQINGVTYDDGSNITDAVHTLVRAAKVERRK